MNYLVVILGVLLALSSAGNVYQYHQHTTDSVKFGTTSQLAADTKAAAGACSKSVDDLAKAGKTRQAELLKALAGVAPKVSALEAAATVAARVKPDDINDLCGSLGRYWKREIAKERLLTK